MLMVTVAAAGACAGAESDSSRDQPASAPVSSSPANPTVNRKAPSTVVFSVDLEADIYRPEGVGPHPTVMLVHGGGLVIGSRSDYQLVALAEELRAKGTIAVSIDYALNAGYERASVDVRAALGWIRTVDGVDSSRIAMVGLSVGAALVAEAAYQDHVRAIVLASPPGVDTSHVSPDDPETLVLWGTRDTLVEKDSVTALVGRLATAGVKHEFRVIEGAAHSTTVVDHMPQLITWLNTRLSSTN
jgi:acetyl esterase/lipase